MSAPIGGRSLTEVAATEIKACCAKVYASDWARFLVGDTLHPGGLRLTERLAELLRLCPQSRVLDVASGRGESAVHLAAKYRCSVMGIEYSQANVVESAERARRAGLDDRAIFLQGDAENIEIDDASFDAVICECAFCTFTGKHAAAREFARVLRPGGAVGISDVTRTGQLPDDLSDLVAWVACIADAQPVDGYAARLTDAGLQVHTVERHDDALRDLVRGIRERLVGASLLAGVGLIGVQQFDVTKARILARAASDAVDNGTLGYAIVAASKPSPDSPAD